MSIERQEQLQKLDEIIVNSRRKMSAIVSILGWSIESISKDGESVMVCPFNESHRIPTKSLIKHLHSCQWKAESYGEFDLPLSSPSLPDGAPLSIKFDEQLQDNVIKKMKQQNPTTTVGMGGRLIARTSDRLIAKFTREERCAMYEYVIANTVEPDIGKDITDMNKPKTSGDGKTSSYIELLAQERNLKRRRAKYRGVHTNKKSQVEILREVINQQMEMLTEYIAENNDDASDDLRHNLSSKNVTGDRECEKNMKMQPRSDYSAADESFSMVNNDRQYRETSSKRTQVHIRHKRLSDDRGYDQRNNVSRDSRRKKELTEEMRNYTKQHDQSSRKEKKFKERRSYKSHHKNYRHRSKDRHDKDRKRSKSRDHERSRLSRDPKYAN